MDDDDDLAVTPSSVAATAASAETTKNTSLNSHSPARCLPDDEDLDEAAGSAVVAVEATRDTLADGLIAHLLRPCVERLDASVQCTRLSQLDLKLQLDSLAADLKCLSLAQHDYMFAAESLQSPSATSKTTSSVSACSSTDTCTLLDGYARRLCDARAKIAVVGNILESTQERLRALSHRIGREHNNRRSLLEPQSVVTCVATEETDLDDDFISEEYIADEVHDDQNLLHKMEDTDPDKGDEEQQETVIYNAEIATLPTTSELPKSS